MTSLNEYIDPNFSTSDAVHSSGYAQAASGGTIGAGGGGLSMDQRRKQTHNIVGSYAQSHLGRRYSAIKARTADQNKGRVYDAGSDDFSDKARFSNRQPGGLKADAIDKTVPRRQFIEPAPRRHDPYGG